MASKQGGGMSGMFQQVKKMQEEMKKIQEELAFKYVEASAGGDMVNIKMNGHNELKEIRISPEVVNPKDIEMLQDLIIAAINEGYRKAAEMANEEMSKITGGIKIPGLNMGDLF